MKKNVSMLALVIALAFAFSGCTPKDADIQKNVQNVISSNPDAVGVSVNVEKQVAILTGEVKDVATSEAVAAAAQGVKGVKSVVNSITITPVPVVEINENDTLLTTQLTDALKDNPTVSFVVKDGIVTLTGEIKKGNLAKLIQKVQALNPAKVENNLTIK
ncbi:MAG: BON domain-containing protein [Paludibacteraceae bacterium]